MINIFSLNPLLIYSIPFRFTTKNTILIVSTHSLNTYCFNSFTVCCLMVWDTFFEQLLNVHDFLIVNLFEFNANFLFQKSDTIAFDKIDNNYQPKGVAFFTKNTCTRSIPLKLG